MSGDAHVRFCERLGVQLPWATHLVILCKTVNQAVHAFKTMRNVLTKLKLELAEEKTRIAEVHEGFNFLGHTFWKPQEVTYTFPTDKAMRAYKDKIRILT